MHQGMRKAMICLFNLNQQGWAMGPALINNNKFMKEKFEFIYNTIKSNMEKLDKKQISVDQAKAMASLAKQANNVVVTQLDASKFIANVKDAKTYLDEVGL